ncbi:hypothetical protein MH117_06340 [Paenibacillus sp. ACRRX]|uniref:hypothetical protein n=1 Tax=Paenibacillus sp. ACRRX TaxID=2918206 RepID=UPI001EF60FB6|nr:hypothetical protein [Paenibacillus sp. ACRRX]MCG7407032.1 hypothetical protein [Paenibacillus sp. ACRRX]
MSILWVLSGTVMMMTLLCLLLYQAKCSIKKMERRIFQEAKQELALNQNNVIIIGVDYAHSSFKKIDAIMSKSSSQSSNIVVVMHGPDFLVRMKQKIWKGCGHVLPASNEATSKWTALLREKTEVIAWNGVRSVRYTEVEMYLETQLYKQDGKVQEGEAV